MVKTELLRFVLRGPATGLLALVTIIFITPTSRILGLPGQSFMPFAVVAVVLLWQWMVALALPYLERRLVYSGEEADQLEKLGTSQRAPAGARRPAATARSDPRLDLRLSARQQRLCRLAQR